MADDGEVFHLPTAALSRRVIRSHERSAVDIRVHMKHIDLTDELRDLAREKVTHAVRVFDGAVDSVALEFSERQNPRRADERFRMEITTLVTGRVVRVEAAAPEPRTAIDQATDRFERRLRDLKERLITTHRRGEKRLNDPQWRDEDEREDRVLAIDRVKRFEVKPMTTEEAALQMELLGHSFYLFLNADTDRYSVLYRRSDGSLGLIEAV